MHIGAVMLNAFGRGSSGRRSTDGMEEPAWTTPHEIILDTAVMRVRMFGRGDGLPIVVVAPYSMHGAALADIAPGFSLVERLLGSGLDSVMLVEWKSATPQMRYLGIDDYLLHLSMALDDIGKPATLIGLCQGGWLSLMLAARFPGKVSRLVLVGAPIDVDAAPSQIVDNAHLAFPEITSLVADVNGGLVSARALGSLWSKPDLGRDVIFDALQAKEVPQGTVERFERWYASTLDLPGAYFSQVVEDVFRRNKLARGEFHALGRSVDLSAVRKPVFVVASEDDEIVPLRQALAICTLIGTPADQIAMVRTRGSHLSLFMGARNLDSVWRDVASWIRSQTVNQEG